MTEFRILGPVELWIAGRSVGLGPGKQRAVLAVLLVDSGHVVQGDTLIDRVWGESPPAEVRGLVYTHVSRIRRRFTEVAAAGVGLSRRPGGYLLEVDADSVDLHRFRHLVAAARSAGDPEQAACSYRQALDLWRGNPCADLSGTWFDQLRAELNRERTAALADRIDVELLLGRHTELLPELRTLHQAHPLDERLAAQAILAAYRGGQQAEALERYEEIRRRLADELGVDPGPELQQLHQRMLRGDPALSPADRISVRATAAPGDFRPVPAQLPNDVAGFTGRDRELADLYRLVAAEPTTAVVISAIAGTAGVGKTALAVHWAHQVRGRFPDGQLYVNLRGVARIPPMAPVEALGHFLHALGVPHEQIPVELELATNLYRSVLADKRVLILLDNAASAEQVRPLLPGIAGCLVLVTSRDRLGGLVARDGARRLALDVLTPAEANQLLVRILGHDRVRTEPDAVSELARLCAYLPLALRIAAAALTDAPRRTVSGYVSELTEGRLATLAVEGDETTGVRATFDLSYTALAPQAQRLFRLLGLVPGPDVTAETAAALADIPVRQARTLLGRLVTAHLLDEHIVDRYACHDLLRAYAVEQASGDPDAQAAGRRLHAWYLGAVDAAARQLYPEKLRLPVDPPDDAPTPDPMFDSHTQAVAWLDAELANLSAAARHGPRQIAWLVADALRGYFWLRRNAGDWRVIARAGLAAAAAEGNEPAQVAAHLSLGDACRARGDFDRAIEHYTQGLALGRRSGWLEGVAGVLSNLGLTYWQLGRLQAAADQYAEALRLNQLTDRLGGQAAVLGNLGLVYRDMGRLEASVNHYAQALALHRKLGARTGEANALGNLAEAYHALGRLDLARSHLTESLALHRELGEPGAEAECLRILAEIHRDAGQYREARESAQAALSVANRNGDPRWIAEVLNTVASIDDRLGQHDQAIEHHQRALELLRGSRIRQAEVAALVGLARAHHHSGQSDHALTHGRQALDLARQMRYRLWEGHALTALANTHLAMDQLGKAAFHARQAVELHRDTGHRLGLAHALLALGHAARDTDGGQAGRPEWDEALALFTAIGAPEATQVRTLTATDR
ncbi:MAG TPA: tetratricopeptide repeat protein [Pilimelia sp.]|nr:tetratricopeptide repeat protein [Pilimelia sp.]